LVDAVPTSDLIELSRQLKNGSRQRVIAHGVAGVGKTTTLRRLQDSLPTGSVVLLFDCWGGGLYFEPSEGRHLPQRLILQLANELAVRCGTPLLLRAPAPTPELWSILRERIEQAARGLAGHDRLLVIAVDAADNAMYVARETGDTCFLPQLWH